MIIKKELLRCMKCKSSITVFGVTGKAVDHDEVEAQRFKDWRKKHGDKCVETEKTETEVTI